MPVTVVRHLAGWRCRFRPAAARLLEESFEEVSRLAFRKALSERIKAGDVLTVDAFSVKEPKTKAFVSLIKGHTGREEGAARFGCEFDETSIARRATCRPVLLATAADVNTEQLLAFDKIIVTPKALEQTR